MSEPNVVHTLRRKRDEIEAVIATYERRLVEARRDLQHVAATLQLFEAATAPEGVRVYQDIHRLFTRGELVTIAKAALAELGPMDTRELSQAVMEAKGFAADAELRKAIAAKLIHALDKQAKRGGLTCEGYRKGVRIWNITHAIKQSH